MERGRRIKGNTQNVLSFLPSHFSIFTVTMCTYSEWCALSCPVSVMVAWHCIFSRHSHVGTNKLPILLKINSGREIVVSLAKEITSSNFPCNSIRRNTHNSLGVYSSVTTDCLIENAANVALQQMTDLVLRCRSLKNLVCLLKRWVGSAKPVDGFYIEAWSLFFLTPWA